MLSKKSQVLGFAKSYWLLLLYVFLIGSLASSFHFFSDSYAISLGASVETTRTISVISTLVLLVLFPLAGHLGDILGYRKMLVLGSIASIISVLLSAFSFHWIMAALALLLGSVGSAVASPSVLALIGKVASKNRFGFAYGLLYLVQNLSDMVGLTILTFTILTFSFHSILRIVLVVGILPIIAGIGLAFRIRDSPSGQKTWKGFGDFLGKVEAQVKSAKSRPIWIVQLGYQLVMGFSVGNFALYALEWLGFSSSYLSIINIIGLLAAMITSAVSGYLADKYGRKTILIVGLAVSGVSSLAFVSSSSLQFAVSSVALTASAAALWPAVNASVASLTQADERGTAFGTLASVRSLGYLLSSVLASLFYDYSGIPSLFFLSALAFFGLGVYAWRAFPKSLQATSPQGAICRVCGYSNPQGFQFCGNCGAPLTEEETRIY